MRQSSTMSEEQSEMIPNHQGNAVPVVTVAMPIYNAGEHLRLAVLSIVKQTFKQWELLIIDDGSTDNALQEITDIPDPRIRIYRDGVNRGLAARLNEAIDLARGLYLARMDQDDVSYPQRFDFQVRALKNDPDLDLVAVRAITISNNNTFTGWFPMPFSREKICAYPWRGFYLPHPTWMGKISWFRKHRYAIPGPYCCEDQELLLRSYDKSRFEIITKPLFAYRLRDSVNWNKLLKTRLTVLWVQLLHFIEKRQPLYASMAFLTFVGRILLDVLKPFSWISYPLATKAGADTCQQWRDILTSIQNGAA